MPDRAGGGVVTWEGAALDLFAGRRQPGTREVEMNVGKVNLDRWVREKIREYLLVGLGGENPEVYRLSWPINGKFAVEVDESLRILNFRYNDLLSLDSNNIYMPLVPFSTEMERSQKTLWLQIAIEIANQVGLLEDEEIMGLIEKRVKEEVLEGQIMGAQAREVAESEGGQKLRQFAWSTDGKLAAKVGSAWRLPNGEEVEVDRRWAVMAV